MNELTRSLRSALEAQRDPTKAGPMQKYMKDLFPYFGIKSPELSVIFQNFFSDHGYPKPDELPAILEELWEQPEREFQYIATGLLRRGIGRADQNIVKTIEGLVTTKSWWDTVDTIATNSVGPFFMKFPNVRNEWLPKWIASENLWLRRVSILFQLNYGKNVDFPLLTSIIEHNLGSKEFFINKAIGWALREYSKTDRQAVIAFCESTTLQPLSKREALKWMNSHPINQ